MWRYKFLLSCSLMTSTVAMAQQHVHDEGQLLLVQENNQWQVQFVLPAINAFGFEHKPESQADKQAIKKFIQTINKPNNVIDLGEQCRFVSLTESLSSNFLASEIKDN